MTVAIRTKQVLLRWWLTSQAERHAMWIAWHLPRWLVYWAAIRLMAHATTGQYGSTDPSSLSVMTALKRWEP